MDNEANDMDDVVCPACGSIDIQLINEQTDMSGIGLYGIYGFIGKVYEGVVKYECQQCLHRF